MAGVLGAGTGPMAHDRGMLMARAGLASNFRT